jgi:hypothetical protein
LVLRKGRKSKGKMILRGQVRDVDPEEVIQPKTQIQAWPEDFSGQ